MLPPAITVRKAGPEIKKVALEKKFIIKIPKSPNDKVSLKVSLNTKAAIEIAVEKTKRKIPNAL